VKVKYQRIMWLTLVTSVLLPLVEGGIANIAHIVPSLVKELTVS